MLKFLQKLLSLLQSGQARLFGRHGEPDKEAPAVKGPRLPGLTIKDNGPFPAEIIDAAIDAADDYGPYIWPSVTLAQWALESNYGKSMPKGSNNPFGIKAVKGQSAVDAMTWEEENGKRVNKVQSFRKFGSLSAAFSAHNKLLATSKYYAKARKADTAVKFARALTGVYATDSQYDAKLRSIMGKHNLYQYDR